MTVSATNGYSGPFTGNGATTAFPYTFKALSDDEVQVLVDGEVVASGYTVTRGSLGNGGTVTFASAPAADTEIVIASDPDFSQDISFTNAGQFLASSHDTLGDRSAIRDIALKRDVERSIKLPIGSAPEVLAGELAGMYLAFGIDGNPVASSGTGADAGLRTDLAAPAGAALAGATDPSGARWATVQGFINYLVASGSSVISWTKAATGAIARTLASLFEERTHVFDFIPSAYHAAIINGTSTQDVGSYIQAGINAVSAAGGGDLLFPAGKLVTGVTLNRPSHVSLRGQGKTGTCLAAAAALNAPVIQSIGTLAGTIYQGGVFGMTVYGSGKANTGSIGIKNVYTNRCTIRDVDVHGAYRGIWTENVWQDVWDNVHVHGAGTDQSYIGFYFAPKAAVVGVSNGVIANACIAQGVEKYGWRIENCNGSKFTSCEGMDGEIGWYLGAPSSGSEAFEFSVFTGCLGDTNSQYNWKMEKGAATAFRQPQFANCWAGTATITNIYVVGCSEVTFSNWQVVNSPGHGMHFQSCSRVSITGSNIRNYNSVTGANHGVLLQDSDVVAMSSNQIYTTTPGTGKAVAETGTSNNNIIVGNALAWGRTIIGGSTVNQNNIEI